MEDEEQMFLEQGPPPGFRGTSISVNLDIHN